MPDQPTGRDLFHLKATSPDTGDELTLTEQPDGTIELTVVNHDNHWTDFKQATIVLPRIVFEETIARYTGEFGPVTPRSRT